MKILVLCYEYPPVGGGGGRIAATVASALAARGHKLKFLTGNVLPPHRLPSREVQGGVEILRVPSPRRIPDTCTVPEMAFYVLAAIPGALRLVASFRPDVIHSHFAVPTGAAGWLVSSICRIPHVLTVHLGDVPGGVPEQTDRMFRWIKPFTIPIWRSAAEITAVSSFVAELAHRAYRCNPTVIPNGILLPEGPTCAPESPPLLLFVGRMSVQKNPLLAVEALAHLREIPWTAAFVGDGPLRAEAERAAAQLGIAARIRFYGWLHAQELAALRRKASVLLIPSLSEGLPMAAVEALADGLAIIGTRIPGLADVVEPGGNGLLAPADSSCFSAAIRTVLESRELLEKFRMRSREKARDFSLTRIVDAYEETLQSAARKGKSPGG